jgi:hypothetical protein
MSSLRSAPPGARWTCSLSLSCQAAERQTRYAPDVLDRPSSRSIRARSVSARADQ